MMNISTVQKQVCGCIIVGLLVGFLSACEKVKQAAIESETKKVMKHILDPKYSITTRDTEILKKSRNPNITDRLVSNLQHSDHQVKSNIIMALSVMESDASLQQLILLLSDKDRELRKSAVWALLYRKDPKSIDPLVLRIFQDEVWTIRSTAIKALGRIQDKRAVPALIIALDDEFPEIQMEAIQALQLIMGDKRNHNTIMWKKWYAENRSDFLHYYGGDTRELILEHIQKTDRRIEY